MAITDLPLDARPREKLLSRGAAALTDAELLAVLLRVGVRGKSAIELGQQLLDQCGGLAGLLQAESPVKLKLPGLGPAKSAGLLAALELSRRGLAAELQRGPAFSQPMQVRRYLQAELAGERNEIFLGLFLDTRHRLIASERLFQGSIDGASVHPRVLVQKAMLHNAAALIVAHNHPSGVAEPSAADEALTRTLKEALALVDVRLLDHIVVSQGSTVSLAERGLM
ncbi:MAG: RadC family protein [Pseudomonadota bacterium]